MFDYLIGLGTGKSSDDSQQTLTGRQCGQELVDIRAGEQGIGPTVGIADCAAAVEQAEDLLHWGEAGLAPLFLQIQ